MNINRLYKKMSTYQAFNPLFLPAISVHQKNLCFFLTPNLKTQSPPSLRQPTMYVFHRPTCGLRRCCSTWDPKNLQPNSGSLWERWLRTSSVKNCGWKGGCFRWVRVLVTRRRINMEAKNHPIEKENHLPNYRFQVPCRM